MPASISEGIQLYFQLQKADQSLAQLVAAVLVLLVSFYLNFHSLKAGESRLTVHLAYFAGGWGAALLSFPWLKRRFGVLEESPTPQLGGHLRPEPSRMKGSFIIQETDQGFRMIQPMVGANPADLYSFSVGLNELTHFNVMRTVEESNLTYSRRIGGNVALFGKAVADKMRFTFQPQVLPNYLIDDLKRNPGDVYVYIQWPNLLYFVPIQSRYLPVLNNLQSRLARSRRPV